MGEQICSTLYLDVDSASWQWSDQASVADKQDCRRLGDSVIKHGIELGVVGKQLTCNIRGAKSQCH